MVIRRLIAVLVLMVLGIGAANAQTKRIASDRYFGCTSRDYFEKLVRFAVDRDNEAFTRGLTAGIISGTCTMFNAGEEVYLADSAIFSGLIKVRRKGQVAEYWTNVEATR